MLMMRNGVTLLACVVICLGQTTQGPRAQIEQQERQNATTVTVQPGTVRSIPFVLDPQTQGSDEILIKTPEKTVALNLRLPNGDLINSSSAATVGLRWETNSRVWVLGLCDAAESWEIITLPPGASGGQYTLEAKLSESGQATRVCATSFTFGSVKGVNDALGGGDWVKTDHGFYQQGDPVRISLAVTDGGKAVRGANVEAIVFSNDKYLMKATTEVGRLKLNDTGSNGDYVGIFQPPKPGNYQIQVTISGRKGIQTGKFWVTPAAAALLSGAFTTSAGQFHVVMRFRISLEGEYRIQPAFSCGGKTTNYTTVRDLTPGEQEVVTEIAPQQLAQQHLLPPCELIGIHVVRKNPASELGFELVGWWFNKDGQWQSR